MTQKIAKFMENLLNIFNPLQYGHGASLYLYYSSKNVTSLRDHQIFLLEEIFCTPFGPKTPFCVFKPKNKINKLKEKSWKKQTLAGWAPEVGATCWLHNIVLVGRWWHNLQSPSDSRRNGSQTLESKWSYFDNFCLKKGLIFRLSGIF